MNNTSRLFFQAMLDLLFPPQCVVCKRGGCVLCTPCLTAIQPTPAVRCQHCHAQPAPEGLCWQCQHAHRLCVSGLRTVGSYEGALRACIHALKYDGNKRLAGPLGILLAETYMLYGLRADLIIPVPLHQRRQQERGYNQASLLARECATRVGVAHRDDILIRQRATVPQVGLGVRERQQNVAGAFICSSTHATRALVGRTIVVIDDVSTTGATIEACAVPLFNAGSARVWGLVLARPSPVSLGELRFQDPSMGVL